MASPPSSGLEFVLALHHCRYLPPREGRNLQAQAITPAAAPMLACVGSDRVDCSVHGYRSHSQCGPTARGHS